MPIPTVRRTSAALSGLVFPVGYLPFRTSICSDRGLRRRIDCSGLPHRIEDLSVPVTAVAMDLGTGEEVSLDQGALQSHLTTAIPRNAARIVTRVGLLRLHDQIERDLREVSRHIPTVVLPTGIDTWPAPWDFGHSQRLISTATTAATRFLERLRVDGPGLYRAEEPPETVAGTVRPLLGATSTKGPRP